MLVASVAAVDDGKGFNYCISFNPKMLFHFIKLILTNTKVLPQGHVESK